MALKRTGILILFAITLLAMGIAVVSLPRALSRRSRGWVELHSHSLLRVVRVFLPRNCGANDAVFGRNHRCVRETLQEHPSHLRRGWTHPYHYSSRIQRRTTPQLGRFHAKIRFMDDILGTRGETCSVSPLRWSGCGVPENEDSEILANFPRVDLRGSVLRHRPREPAR